jgi:hypothetical protein
MDATDAICALLHAIFRQFLRVDPMVPDQAAT